MGKILAAGFISLAALSVSSSALAQSSGDFDKNQGTTTDFLAKPCASYTDACYGLVWESIASDYWGCSQIRDQGVDENAASKATYDWLRANMAGATSWWLTDLDVAFHAAYPACPKH
jgi:hypothetical protein